MVRPMKWTGRAGIVAVVVLVAVAAASILGAHRVTRSSVPVAASCSSDPRLALGW